MDISLASILKYTNYVSIEKQIYVWLYVSVWRVLLDSELKAFYRQLEYPQIRYL